MNLTQILLMHQLVEFADDCGMSPKLLQQSLVKIANDIINNIDDAISLVIPTSDSQLHYLNRYREIIVARCEHFLKQSSLITEIEL